MQRRIFKFHPQASTNANLLCPTRATLVSCQVLSGIAPERTGLESQ